MNIATQIEGPPNPFPGLRAYDWPDSIYFFGRDRNIDELLERLRSERFVGVVGTSGTGKSSLVLAGMLPRLCAGFETRFGAHWRTVVCRPGTDPFKSLAAEINRALIHDSHDDEVDEETRHLEVELLSTSLRRSDLGLVRLFSELKMPEKANLLIVVDQFEELFRYPRSKDRLADDDDKKFIRLLLEATKQQEQPIYVVITMRIDYLIDCVRYHGLPEAISHGQYLVPRLDRSQRRRAMEGPIGVVGATISGALIDEMLNEAEEADDQLPLLQHALMRTFEYWREDTQRSQNFSQAISLVHYREIGGINEALWRHAEEAFCSLDGEQQRLTERIFRAITERTQQGRGVRRPCRIRELKEMSGATVDELKVVIDRFCTDHRSFLVVRPDERELTEDSVLDVAHESLMRVWGRLREWTIAEAKAAEELTRIADAAESWISGKGGGLWRDPGLALAVRWQEAELPGVAWARRYGADYAKVERFIEESKAAQQRELAEQEAVRQREIAAARQLAAAQEERANVEARARKKLRLRFLMISALCSISFLLFLRSCAEERKAVAANESALKANKEKTEALEQAQHDRDMAKDANVELRRARTGEAEALQKAVEAQGTAEKRAQELEEKSVQLQQANAWLQRTLATATTAEARAEKKARELEEQKRATDAKGRIPDWEVMNP